MHKIKSKEEVKEIINNIRSKKYISNTIVSLNQYIQPIERGTLYYIKNEDFTFFLEDKDKYYSVDFFCINDNPNMQRMITVDKPMMVSIITRKGIAIDDLKSILKKMGFSEYKMHIRMQMSNEVYKNNNDCNDSFIKLADINNISEIKKILDENFDIFTEDIPDEESIKKYIDDKSIILMVNEEHKIMGIVICSTNDGICEIKFCVVKSEYRGMKVAYKLLLSLKDFLSDDISTYFIWMRNENEIAKSLYRKVGFSEDKRISIEFIKY